MLSPISNLGKAWKLLKSSKTNLILAFIPIVIGIALYGLVGVQAYSELSNLGNQMIAKYVSEGTFGEIVGFIVKALITIFIFFFTNWTFVIVVSVFAGPFNDILSNRIEREIRNQIQWSLSESFTYVGKNFFANLFNEFKKLILIITLGFFALVFGYIPVLTPVSIIITILLLAVQFLDYSWSRHNVKVGSCVSDIRRNLIRYGLGGGIFLLFSSVPIFNLIVPSLATSYFTLLWVKNHESRN